MIKDDLIKLIRSLSPIEKGAFRKQVKSHVLSKQYEKLFNLIEDGSDLPAADLVVALRKSFPGPSLDNTAAYLLKLLTELLVMFRVNQDPGYSRYFSLMKIKLFTERSMNDLAQREIRNLQLDALKHQDFMVYYQAIRTELNDHSLKAVPTLTEQDLVEKQFQAKTSLKSLSMLNDHFSLYELLNHRLSMQSGKERPPAKQFNFDDLALSELGIVTRGTQHLFNSKKLHLLFQAYYFIQKGKHPSALQTFIELNTLMENNELAWDFPPYDYLATLSGILNSLVNANQHNEMGYFIQKIKRFLVPVYPDHFLNLCRQTILLYELEMLVNQFQFDASLKELKAFEPDIYRVEFAIGAEAHLKVLFLGGLSAFKVLKFKLSLRYISFAVNSYKKSSDQILYKLCRLLFLMIQSELKNYDTLDYEIRSFKRAIPRDERTCEALLLTAKFDLDAASKAQKMRLWNKVQQELPGNNVLENEYERMLDIAGWIKGKLA